MYFIVLSIACSALIYFFKHNAPTHDSSPLTSLSVFQSWKMWKACSFFLVGRCLSAAVLLLWLLFGIIHAVRGMNRVMSQVCVTGFIALTDNGFVLHHLARPFSQRKITDVKSIYINSSSITTSNQKHITVHICQSLFRPTISVLCQFGVSLLCFRQLTLQNSNTISLSLWWGGPECFREGYQAIRMPGDPFFNFCDPTTSWSTCHFLL